VDTCDWIETFLICVTEEHMFFQGGGIRDLRYGVLYPTRYTIDYMKKLGQIILHMVFERVNGDNPT
jgi:hypothetical protein